MAPNKVDRVMNRIKKKKGMRALFDRLSNHVTHATGSPAAFITALIIIIAWGVSGPIFGFSDTWQLVINTGTTIITFLMVFIIQQSQNKETAALHLKLNELIACNENASNRLIASEDLTEDELRVLKKFYTKLVQLAEKEENIHTSHSLDEAEDLHESKHDKRVYTKKAVKTTTKK
jgi:low affinity Fe/Cu permease